ncbi:radical SAM protein [Aeropyrum camini]|uniref:PflX-like protein n=1 Tax=Aeropyrum camini SY1 = JCM 12091 TaxID=1198449 RepID=U3TGG7_9CREN|nr:radical SAM protein [Aeropyrum camini]BAN90434.1 PflX-like protein [Aeropyrum camini SY1 = JCM 12091]
MPIYAAPEWYLVRPDALYVWRRYPQVEEKLGWYVRVMRGEEPPKFRIVRSFEVGFDSLEDVKEASTEELWREHERVAGEFRRLYRSLREGGSYEEGLEDASPSLMDVKVELVRRLASPCELCERRCRVERARGRRGACRLAWDVYVHSAFLHLGEEAPLVPSGTIFYGGCNFTCVFCQNWDVSQWKAREAVPVTPVRLAEIQDRLAEAGARNINHVGGDPVPSLHVIVESMRYASHSKPQLWNSNMYMTLEALDILVDLIDIWLPDLKFGNNRCAMRLSAVPRYWEVTTRNIRIAAEHGDMIVRHLVMPGHVECCTKPVLRWIAENLDGGVLVNIMDQYHPDNLVLRMPHKWPEIARRPSRREIEEAWRYAEQLGLDWEPVTK